MARIARIVIPGVPHLVAQRGNRGGKVFFSTADRATYLETFGRYARAHRLKVWSYRLLADEARLLVVPPTAAALAETLGATHGRYSLLVNRRQDTTGHLFHGRYYSCPLGGDYVALALRYVERFTGAIPAETSSSAGHHCDRRKPAGILSDDLPLLKSVHNWRAWLSEPVDRADLAELLSRLRVGKPAGPREFVRRVEGVTGLDLSRRPGRPPKNAGIR